MAEGKKNKFIVFRIVLTVLIVAVVLAILLFFLNRDENSSFVNTVRDIFGIKGETADEFYYENAAGKAFGELTETVAVASAKGLLLLNKDGRKILNESFMMSEPAVSTNGEYGVAYDIGGKEICFFTQNKVLLKSTAPKPIISASVSKDGHFAVCTEDDGYNGLVTVYDETAEPVYKWHCSTDYILTATVSEKGKLAILVLGSSGSNIVCFDLSSEEEKARYVYDGLIINICFVEDTVVAVSDREILFLTDEGENKASYSFEGRHLEAYTMGDGFVSFALKEHQFTSTCNIEMVSLSGSLLGTAEFPDGSVILDASGKYVAAMGMSFSKIYTPEAEEYASFDAYGTAGVLMLENGKVMILDPYSASTYPKDN